jgi:glutamate-1-semialdehyde 2,1-aminomutase
LKFEGCYHGAHDYVLVKAGSGATTFGTPNSLGVPEETTRNTLVLPYNNFESFEKAVEREGNEIASVIIEPIIGNAGVILPRKGFLEFIRKLTKEKDIVLIFDEVITGFRLALGGAQEYYGVVPDMATLGKVLGGGFPIAAFTGKKEIMETIAPLGKVYQAGTFSGNPISVAAGLAMLRTIKNRGKAFYCDLDDKRRQLCDAIRDFVEDESYSIQINDVASMFQIFFSEAEVYDYETARRADKEKFTSFHRKLLEKGIFLPPSQFETCFISAAHSKADVAKTVEAIQESLAYVIKKV